MPISRTYRKAPRESASSRVKLDAAELSTGHNLRMARQRGAPYEVATDVQSRGRADDSSARIAAASSGLARRSWWMRNAGPAPGSGAISHASR